MNKTTEQTIFEMMTENTGSALCDSGGAYGRNWERNQKKTLDDFRSAPSAVLDVSKWTNSEGVERWDMYPTIDLFHHLNACLELDEVCHEFNSMPVENWDSEYYGVSAEGEHWLEMMGFTDDGDSFNSYNWSANFSQVVQGQRLDRDGDKYLLLQIHGGCDVRGGYTDAKLFKIDNCYDGFLSEGCGFWVETADGEALSLDWLNEWIDLDGRSADDEYLEKFAKALGEGTHRGEAFEVC